MSPSLLLRVCAVSLTLSVVSFVAGLAGDFSRPPPVYGTTVVVRIPPAVPADSPHAMPLSALPRTASAAAQTLADPIPIMAATPPPGPVGPGASMVLDHEIAHSAGDAAYAAVSDRFG